MGEQVTISEADLNEARNIENTIDRTSFKVEGELTAYEKQVRLLELKRCSESFLRWLKWVKLVEAPTYDSPGGVIKLQLWPHILEITRELINPASRLLVILKARQVGASWIVAAYVLWHALFRNGSLSILFSKGEPEGILLLKKCKDVYGQLPPFMQLSTGKNSDTEMSFPFMNSSIVAKAATESAGVSYQASIVVCDEWQDHEYANKIWLNAKPCIDHGGQFIGIFTSPKPELNKLCVNIFKQARKGQNGFHAIFIPFWARPGNDEKWYQKQLKEVSIDELDGLSPELYMERTYPRSETEALSEASSVSAFDHRVLDEMAGETKNHIREGLPDGIDPKLVHIYQLWQLGGFYIAASDTGHGVGKDYSITVVMNCRTGAVVADIMSNVINESDFAFHSMKLMEAFHNPLWYIETNDWGQVIVNIAMRDGYRNLGYQDKNRNKPGIRTVGGEDGRTLLWGTLIPAINTHQITIFNPEGIKQFRDVNRNSEKQGRIEAKKGGHDDYPMAVGIAWMKREEVKPASSIISGKRY
jgi:hypothetical protein